VKLRMGLSVRFQRPVFNNRSLPPGVKFAPRGELGPPGVELCALRRMFTSFTPRSGSSLKFRRMEMQREDLYPKGTSSPQGDKVHPWEPTSPMGIKVSK
jgi:hypothetical protein